MPETPAGVLERPVAAVGVTAQQLIEHSEHLFGRTPLTADQLERWLLEGGLAVPNGAPNRLIPTEKARVLVAALSPLAPQRHRPRYYA